MKAVKSFLIIGIFMIIIPLIFGNGVGVPVKKEINGYYVEFGIEPQIPKAKEKAIMSFSVHYNNGTPISVDNFFVRISKGNRILFASTDFKISQEGPMYLTYEFTEKGSYNIDISTQINSKKIQESFAVEVHGKVDNLVIYILITLLIGLVIGYFLNRIIGKG